MYQNCKEISNDLVKEFETRNPFELAEYLNIDVYERNFDELLGLYTVILDNQVIILNENLDESLKTFVMAHELGHALLHDHLVNQFDTPSTLSEKDAGSSELEANIFAANLLIGDNEIKSISQECDDIRYISSELNTIPECVQIKSHYCENNKNFDNIRSTFLRDYINS